MAASFASLGIKIDATDVKAANEALNKFAIASKNAEQANKENEAQSVKTAMSYEKTILKLTETKSAYNQAIMASKGFTAEQIAAVSAAERYANSQKSLIAQLFSLKNAFATAAGGMALMQLYGVTKDVVMLADKMTLLESRVKIATKTNEDYKTSSDALTKISLATGSSLESNITLFSRLNKSVESVGGSYKNTLGLVETLNKGLKISGASASESASVVIQLSQALSKGKLNGDEFRSVMENGSRIVDALTLSLGRNRGELQEMATQGKLTSVKVINALQEQSDAINKDFARIPLTIGMALENINTSFARYVQNINNSSSATGKLASSLNFLANNIQPILDGILTLGEVAALVFVSNIAKYIVDYIASIKLAAVETETAALTMAASFKAVLTPIGLLNIALAGLAGWQVGEWLNGFKMVRKIANEALYGVITAIENTTYYWDRLQIAFGKGTNDEKWSQLDSLKKAHESAKGSIEALISADNTYVNNSKSVVNSTNQQKTAVEQLTEKQGINEKEAKKAAKDALNAQIELAKISENIELDSIKTKRSAYDEMYKKNEISSIDHTDKIIALIKEEESAKIQALSKTLDLEKSVEKQVKIQEEIRKIQVDSLSQQHKALVDLESAQKSYNRSLEDEKIKLLELTGQAKLAREEKSRLSLERNPAYQEAIAKSKSTSPTIALQGQQEAQVFKDVSTAQILKDNTEAATKYQERLDAISVSTKDVGVTSTEAFDLLNKGFGGLVTSLNSTIKSFDNTSKAITKTKEEYAKFLAQPGLSKSQQAEGTKKYYEELGKLQEKQVAESVSGARQMAGAASKMFAENSAGRQAMHNIEVVLNAVEVAMSLKKIGVMAIEAVLNQGGGDPYSAFARIAAMAAIVGAVVAGVGGAFSGGAQAMPKPTSSSDTGTLLGDATKSSQSVGNVYTLLKDIQAQNYPELRGINDGVAALSQGITNVITRLFQAGGVSEFAKLSPAKMTGIGQYNFANPLANLGGYNIDPIGNFLIGGLFGGKQTQSVIGQGIQTGATPLSAIMGGGNLSAQQYAEIQTKTSGGWFGSDKYSTSMQYSALDATTQKALDSLFGSMGKTMLSLADALGMGLSERVRNYVIPALTVNLKGLSGDEAAKKLNGIISTALDLMSTAVFGDVLSQYQKLGEGMLETAIRIVSEVAVVKDALASSGLSLSTNAIAITDSLVQAAGGLKEFQVQFNSFFDKFFSESEKQAKLYETLTSSFQTLNILLPGTREGYKNLVSGLNLVNEQDQKRYSMLLSLSGAADTYYSGIEDANANAQQSADDLSAKMNQLAQNRANMEITLLEAQGKKQDALIAKRIIEMSTMDDSLKTLQLAIYAAQDYNTAQADLTAAIQKSVTQANTALDTAFAQLNKVVNVQIKAQQDLLNSLTSIADKIRAALGVTTGTTAGVTLSSRASAQATIQTALTAAQGGQSLANFPGLENALTEISKPGQQLYSTFAEYALDQAKASANISQLSGYADNQVSVAQQSLTVLEQILIQAQLQVDVLRNVNTSMLTVPVAMSNFTIKLDAATLAQTYAIQVNTAATGSVSEAMNSFINAGIAATSTQLSLAQQAANSQSAAASSILTASTTQATASLTTTGAVLQLNATFASFAATMSGYMSTSSAQWASQKAAWSANATSWQTLYNVWASQYTYAYLGNPSMAGTYTSSSISSSAAAANIPGFAVGINEVPYDMTANIHAGERIMPAADNKELMMRLSEPRSSGNAELIAELRFLRDEVSRLKASNEDTARTNKKISDLLLFITRDGQYMLTHAV